MTKADRKADRELLLALTEALSVSRGRLRRDPCGDWIIEGTRGHILCDGAHAFAYVPSGTARLLAKWSPEMAIIGYARVSTQDQHLTGQLEALKAAGAETIYREKISCARADRPQLGKLMASLKAGDVVLVTKLDRLGRSTLELLDLIERISGAGAAFRSLGDPLWDTSSSQGRLLSTHLAATRLNPRTHWRWPQARYGQGCQVRSQAEAVGLPAAGGHQAPRRGRDAGRDRQELRRRYLDDLSLGSGLP
jgi:hypothetical protein